MKKLVFMFVAMAAVSFASCGGSDANQAEQDSLRKDSLVKGLVEPANEEEQAWLTDTLAKLQAPVEEATEAPAEEATEAPAEEATEAPAENA